VFVISDSLANLGAILSVNAQALSMFGYNKRDLLGQNISVVIPAPMNASHDLYLRRCLDNGRAVVREAAQERWCGCCPGHVSIRVPTVAWGRQCAEAPVVSFHAPTMCILASFWQTKLNATRTLFCRHATGALFPALLNVKTSPEGFVGVMQKLVTNDQ
jgi:hypothetical protein